VGFFMAGLNKLGGKLKDMVKVALCQLSVGTDKFKNIEGARRFVQRAANQGAELVLLPEIWNGPYSTDSFSQYAEPLPSSRELSEFIPDSKLHPSSKLIRDLAEEHKIWIIGGSISERDGDKLYNTCLVANPEGKFIAKHRKVHLFDIDVPGKITFKESDSLSPGNEITMFESPFGKIGVGICYDIRFAEYAQICAQNDCTILCYPGAFNTVTGPAHWELLQRARAVDNQVFVLTCSPARNPESKYQAWGHSSAISPWGEVLATTEHAEDMVMTELNLNRVNEVRQNIPVRKQKRLNLYQLPSLISDSNSNESSAKKKRRVSH